MLDLAVSWWAAGTVEEQVYPFPTIAGREKKAEETPRAAHVHWVRVCRV